MATEIRCPHCGQNYGLSDEQVPQYSGQTIACTKCQQQFTVPNLIPPGTPPPYPRPMPGPMSGPASGGQPGQPGQPVSYATPHHYQHQSNPMAVASLVCGVLGFCIPVISSLLAIIFGIVGLRRTRDPAVGGKGLAVAGISLGGISMVMAVFILPLMLGIMLPSLNRARETANRVKCAANMKSLGQAMLLYANDYRGQYPPGLPELILDQQISAEVFICPSGDLSPAIGTPPAQLAQMIGAGSFNNYVYTGAGKTTAAGADTVLLYEPLDDHRDGSNFLFADGHVDFYTRATAEPIIARLKGGQNPP